MKRRFYSSEIEEPTINLTPLIDVVFVILIMFILVAPMLELDRIELAKASPSSSTHISVQEKGPLVIHVRKDNTLLLNQEKLSIEELAKRLKQAKKGNSQGRPQLFHDKQAYFGTYQSVKNALEDAGFDQVDVILKPS